MKDEEGVGEMGHWRDGALGYNQCPNASPHSSSFIFFSTPFSLLEVNRCFRISIPKSVSAKIAAMIFQLYARCAMDWDMCNPCLLLQDFPQLHAITQTNMVIIAPNAAQKFMKNR